MSRPPTERGRRRRGFQRSRNRALRQSPPSFRRSRFKRRNHWIPAGPAPKIRENAVHMGIYANRAPRSPTSVGSDPGHRRRSAVGRPHGWEALDELIA